VTNSAHFNKELWKAGHAWLAFKTVLEICNYILAHDLETDSIVYSWLVTAICTWYTRPFTASRGIGPLSKNFVPAEHRDLHNQIILGRNRTIAHSDADGPMLQGLPANTVRLVVKRRRAQLKIHHAKFQRSMISSIRELASGLVDRILDHIRDLAGNHRDELPDDGEYLIDLTTGHFVLVPALQAKSLESPQSVKKKISTKS
jgi:hypothetical protein